jgi:phage tail-like protein
MNTALFNEGVFNGGDRARTVGIRVATVVSRRMVRQCESRSAVSVCGDLLLEPATRVNVQHARLCDCGADFGISRSRVRQSAAAITIAHDCSSNAAARIRVDRSTVSDYGMLIGIPRLAAHDASSLVRVAARRLRDSETVLSVGAHRVIAGETATRIDRVRTRNFSTGVSVPGSLDRAAQTAVSVGAWRFLEAPTILYPKRTRTKEAATRIQIDRIRGRDFSTDLFVGRKWSRAGDTTLSVGAGRSRPVSTGLRIDRVRRRDTATGLQIDRSWFDTHLLDLLPSVWREQDTTGDLAAFLKIPAVTLDEFKNQVDALPSVFDVDDCDPAFLPLLAALIGWPLDPDAHTDVQRRALREAVEFYRRKGTIPAIVRSLENIGWRGRLIETFRAMLRTNRRARLNAFRLAGTVFNQGVYQIESDNIVPGVRTVLAPHHPAGARVFFLQRMDGAEDVGQDAEAGFRHASRRGAFARQYEDFILNDTGLNSPLPLTRRVTVYGALQVRSGAYAVQEMTASHGIVERWQRPIPGFTVNRDRMNQSDIVNADRTAMRLSLELDVDVGRNSGRTVPLQLNKRRLNQTGPQQGSAYRWCFRQMEDKGEIPASLESAANEYIIRQWPAA